MPTPTSRTTYIGTCPGPPPPRKNIHSPSQCHVLHKENTEFCVRSSRDPHRSEVSHFPRPWRWCYLSPRRDCQQGTGSSPGMWPPPVGGGFFAPRPTSISRVLPLCLCVSLGCALPVGWGLRPLAASFANLLPSTPRAVSQTIIHSGDFLADLGRVKNTGVSAPPPPPPEKHLYEKKAVGSNIGLLNGHNHPTRSILTRIKSEICQAGSNNHII